MLIDITQNIKDLVAPIAESKGVYAVDVEVKTGGKPEVWVYLDAETRGVNHDECAAISRELGFIIEANELFEDKYLLNVSSPGLSRPLTDYRQYVKNIGRTAKIKYKSEEDYHKLECVIKSVDEEGMEVESDEGKSLRLLFEDVLETKIIPKI